MLQRLRVALSVLLSFCGPPVAQPSSYTGALGGVSTLSVDGRSLFVSGGASTSLDKPENGFLLSLFAGVHLSDFLSVQANYVWNRNVVALVSLVAPDHGTALAYQQNRSSRQHAVFGEGLLFFRNRDSRVRPFLSAGIGAVSLRSEEKLVTNVSGNPVLPPKIFSAAKPAFRTAIGIDLSLGPQLHFVIALRKPYMGTSSAVTCRLLARGTWPTFKISLASWSGLNGAETPRRTPWPIDRSEFHPRGNQARATDMAVVESLLFLAHRRDAHQFLKYAEFASAGPYGRVEFGESLTLSPNPWD